MLCELKMLVKTNLPSAALGFVPIILILYFLNTLIKAPSHKWFNSLNQFIIVSSMYYYFYSVVKTLSCKDMSFQASPITIDIAFTELLSYQQNHACN